MRCMAFLRFLLGSLLGVCTPLFGAELPRQHIARALLGWQVQVDVRLLSGGGVDAGNAALVLLEAKLRDISTLLPQDRVEQLRKVPIWLDLDHGELTSMQYHPSADWLEDHGYSRALAKAVHIPVAAVFLDAKHQHVQPWCVLHELAHAYHDQVLGFADARVLAAFQRYAQSGRGKRVLHVDGRMVRHYAMTNEKEFFAEMTEAYFGTNDFFPFVFGELKQAEPEIFTLLREIWGPTRLESGASK